MAALLVPLLFRSPVPTVFLWRNSRLSTSFSGNLISITKGWERPVPKDIGLRGGMWNEQKPYPSVGQGIIDERVRGRTLKTRTRT